MRYRSFLIEISLDTGHQESFSRCNSAGCTKIRPVLIEKNTFGNQKTVFPHRRATCSGPVPVLFTLTVKG